MAQPVEGGNGHSCHVGCGAAATPAVAVLTLQHKAAMAQSAPNKMSSAEDLGKQSPVPGVLLVLALLNWCLYAGISMYLHGDALGTLPSRDGFIVTSHGRHSAVSESAWLFSLFYSGATLLLTPAICLAAATLLFGRQLKGARWHIRVMLGGFILLWCLAWYSSIGRSFCRSVEDWHGLTRPHKAALAANHLSR